MRIGLLLTLSLIFGACTSTDPGTHIVEGPRADGCPGVGYPDWRTSEYVLPYPVGETYTVDLSTCSGSYHSDGLPDAFAIDFSMPVGTRVTASRQGEVVRVVESGVDGPGSTNNLVVVKHSDGTYAQYMHLTHNGAQVEVGDDVEQGDEIGLSGVTGLAGYPHLHFVVTEENWPYPYVSIPVTFSNTASNLRSLASGHSYPAFPY